MSSFKVAAFLLWTTWVFMKWDHTNTPRLAVYSHFFHVSIIHTVMSFYSLKQVYTVYWNIFSKIKESKVIYINPAEQMATCGQGLCVCACVHWLPKSLAVRAAWKGVGWRNEWTLNIMTVFVRARRQKVGLHNTIFNL